MENLLGLKIKHIKKVKDLTDQALGDLFDTSAQNVNQIINGVRSPVAWSSSAQRIRSGSLYPTGF
jgi:hypothetical protein